MDILMAWLFMFNEEHEEDWAEEEELIARHILQRQHHPKIENYFEFTVPQFSPSGRIYLNV